MSERKFSPEFEARKWKPGQSGNPAGGKKRKSMEAIAQQVLDEKVTLPSGESATNREIIVRIVIDEAMKRNWKAVHALLSRFFPVPHKMELGGMDGGPITLADWIQLDRQPPESYEENGEQGDGESESGGETGE